MTVDLLAATFWPEGALFGPHVPYPLETEPVSVEPERPAAADAPARAGSFWAAVIQMLRRSPDAPALP